MYEHIGVLVNTYFHPQGLGPSHSAEIAHPAIASAFAHLSDARRRNLPFRGSSVDALPTLTLLFGFSKALPNLHAQPAGFWKLRLKTAGLFYASVRVHLPAGRTSEVLQL